MDVPWRAGQVGVENGYQYNGIERNEDFGLNVDLAEFRSYDAAVGRWWQVDPLAEIAPDWSPYRFGFNNPILNTDPLGLFETRDEARQYKRDHDLRGRIRKQSDGSFAIENRRDHSSTFRDSELGVVSAALVAAPKDGYTGLAGSDRREPYQGFWGGLNYLLTGGIDNGVQYNRDGYPLGPAPQLTMPPPVGPGRISSVVEAAKSSTKLPTQIHHFATNKHSVWTSKMAEIAKQYGLDLNGAWNKAAMPHLGRHPEAYHKFVFQNMQRAATEAKGNQAKFLQLFDQYVKQPVLQNPSLLLKSGW